jgi:hypothetical protein
LRVESSGFRDQGSGFRAQGSGFRVQGSGRRGHGLGCAVQGSELNSGRKVQSFWARVWGLGFEVWVTGYQFGV